MSASPNPCPEGVRNCICGGASPDHDPLYDCPVCGLGPRRCTCLAPSVRVKIADAIHFPADGQVPPRTVVPTRDVMREGAPGV